MVHRPGVAAYWLYPRSKDGRAGLNSNKPTVVGFRMYGNLFPQLEEVP